MHLFSLIYVATEMNQACTESVYLFAIEGLAIIYVKIVIHF